MAYAQAHHRYLQRQSIVEILAGRKRLELFESDHTVFNGHKFSFTAVSGAYLSVEVNVVGVRHYDNVECALAAETLQFLMPGASREEILTACQPRLKHMGEKQQHTNWRRRSVTIVEFKLPQST